jgi:hypothetical protein
MGCALAATMVVVGAPIFSAGLRALRLRRHLRTLAEQPLSREASGLVLVRGRVALESPLVGPLSGKPCAGFVIEVLTDANHRVATIEDRRPFRLIEGGAVARVVGAEQASWDLAVTHERAIRPGDPISQNLTALLAGSAEVTWMRRSGATLTLIERALLVGQACHVLGSARAVHPYEIPSETLLARTGTDDLAIHAAPGGAAREPDLWIESDGHMETLRIFDRAPDLAELSVPAWRTLGVALGPALGLAGLIYLASVADRLRGRSF